MVHISAYVLPVLQVHVVKQVRKFENNFIIKEKN
jgi:hypothetical protein